VNYVGLDLSLRGAGVCVLNQSGEVLHTVKVGYALKRSSRVKDKVERMLCIAKAIVRVIDEYTVRNDGHLLTKHTHPMVGIEGYAFSGRGNALFDLGELGGVVKSQLWLRFAVEPALIASSSGRKVVLGNGRMKKVDVIPQLEKKYGLLFTEHDIADAYVVAKTLQMRSEPPHHRG